MKQAVSGIIFNHDRSEVLLIKRRDIPVWVLPGGGIDLNESCEEAIVRELEEETGCKVSIVKKIAEYLPVNKLTQLTHSYECSIQDGDLKATKETLGARFFPLSALPKMPPPYFNWISDAKDNNGTILRKKIEGVSYFVLLKFLCRYPVLVCRYLLTKCGIHLNSHS